MPVVMHRGVVHRECLHGHSGADGESRQDRKLESDEVSHVCRIATPPAVLRARFRYSKPCCQGDQPHTARRRYFGYQFRGDPVLVTRGYFRPPGAEPEVFICSRRANLKASSETTYLGRQLLLGWISMIETQGTVAENDKTGRRKRSAC